MRKSLVFNRITACLTIVSVGLVGAPLMAADASLGGNVFSATTQAPIAGAKVHAADPSSGQIFHSTQTSGDGAFSLSDLPAARYELAVEAEGGLYLVETPLTLAPGQTQNLQLAITPEEDIAAQADDDPNAPSLWNNAAMASLVVAGIATFIGFVIKELDDEKKASPSGS